MPHYRRWRVPGGTYFFTINLLERRSDLLVRHIDALRAAVRRTRQERPFRIDAWVVLTEHLHCILTLPEGNDDFVQPHKSDQDPLRAGPSPRRAALVGARRPRGNPRCLATRTAVSAGERSQALSQSSSAIPA